MTSFNSPLLNQLWEQGEEKLTEQKKVFLHMQLTSLDQIQTELKYSIDNNEQNKINRLSVDLRRGIENLISEYKLEMPRPDLAETGRDWNN
ncbi:hypothetical protein, partial [Salmonella sp. s51228]|uniref:hypothetical protein n=1 Tax=Salmonella sp. s51228 TaxID=3159652 RepID=UPI00398104F6